MTASDIYYSQAIAHLRHLIDQAYKMGEREPTAEASASASRRLPTRTCGGVACS